MVAGLDHDDIVVVDEIDQTVLVIGVP